MSLLSSALSMSAFALAASISPGPVNLVCLSSGTRYPLARGLVFVTGATLGFIALFLAIGFGLGALLAERPELERWLTVAGVLFLLYLCVQLARDDGRLDTCDAQRAPGFVSGALMQWLNPKAWLASAAGIGAFAGSDTAYIALFAALYLPICWLSLSAWVLAGASLRSVVNQPRVLRAINRVLAVLLASSCLLLLL
ncbi:LysE family translocator [Parahaliea aestuarii]|uniref:LysE family translocator n=1 Tax=Parahaliea aestuarii TaxID=1852021 RepID=A0A5C8ZTH5_9GAMM|nr:LysE family translocator [Parahaliea aestuarii]TXS90980.1 LysE family translocator [Parahaliea aestuarii]